ncbi:hypothetical protein D9615_008679 [Tricholomella constricta]|uniref:Uncharacterized protein n=1 Tax=Tricholomella constricta TaxID=117010 RepID=A0A8H5H4A8_9AGAR|nr:hypothetical protein D9615_008679 [Tricholomella constricta]
MHSNFSMSPIALNSSSQLEPVMQHQAVATLLMIENSQAMSLMWSDLQDRYLLNVMTRFENANPAAPITTLILESLPTHDTGFPAVPRQYSAVRAGLQDVRFNWDPQNRLTAGKIWSGIEFLASTEFQGQPVVRHLVIVAASTPFDDTFGMNTTSYSGSTPWHQLAHRLTQADIQCHMVLSPSQDMGPFMTLFSETLRLQNFIEESPSFPIDPRRVLLRLSARSNLYSGAGSVPHTNPTSQRVLPRRNHSFPLPSRPSIDDDMLGLSPPNDTENPPSLVSQLQQVHGLTKKKVYGAKPARKPFFREERVRKESPGAPAPLILPNSRTSGSPRSNGHGRALSNSKASRISRVAQGSPTELQSRRPGLPRRNSRMSSPETDGYPSPTSFSVPSDLSPVSPTTHSQLYIQPAPVVPLQPETSLDPSWGTMQYKPPLNSSLTQTQFPSYSSQSFWQNSATEVSRPSLQNVTAPYTTAAHRPLSLDLGAKVQAPPNGAENTSPYRLPRRSSCPEDEEPFTFNAEYVAATAALFKNEILPSYPDLQPAFEELVSPRRAFYIAQDQGSMPPSPSSPYDPGELYVAAERDELRQQSSSLSLEYPMPAEGSPGLSYATSYSPGSSSSLTGWAG